MPELYRDHDAEDIEKWHIFDSMFPLMFDPWRMVGRVCSVVANSASAKTTERDFMPPIEEIEQPETPKHVARAMLLAAFSGLPKAKPVNEIAPDST